MINQQATLEIPTIAALNAEKGNFFVRDYQRGYRWTPVEVRALLNDILNFQVTPVKGSVDQQWYCLQPVVTKKLSPEDVLTYQLDPSKVWFEVIDGQQRVTTIFLITRYINCAWRGADPDPEPVIRYQTRPDSAVFLDALSPHDLDSQATDTNIDFYHMTEAFRTICRWAQSLSRTDPMRNKDEFVRRFLNYTRVIWYETLEPDSIAIFTRMNMYKISLTNAELVKALILNRSNFSADLNANDKLAQHKQYEIAHEWDRIESTLQRPDFWAFIINPKLAKYGTRIEYLFDLLSEKTADEEDVFFTFNYFREELKAPNQNSEILWEKVKSAFQRIEGWFESTDEFHEIGYLIWSGVSLRTILAESMGDDLTSRRSSYDAAVKDAQGPSTKKQFWAWVRQEIQGTVAGVDLEELKYHDHKLVNILLLHNLRTLALSKEHGARFPFHEFKKDSWDVEHVHALADSAPQDSPGMVAWLQESLPFLDGYPELQSVAMEHLQKNQLEKSEFDTAYQKIVGRFQDLGSDENSIGNLVLLDSGTNRSYKASLFPIKRQRVIERVRTGGFVPVSTRNVFLKFYNEDVGQVRFWGPKDREAYKADLRSLLGSYLQLASSKGANLG